MSAAPDASRQRISWTCPQCSLTVPVRTFPVHCQCGFVQYENPPGPGDRTAIVLAKVGVTEKRVKEAKAAIGLKGDCGCKRRQRWMNRLGTRDDKTSLEWAYGVTTVPARIASGLLDRTLASLHAAGFPRPRLFIDGCCEVPAPLHGYPITQRVPRIGTPPNWTLGLHELYMRQPFADRYAMFQDDFLTVKNLRLFLERTPYPKRGYLNLHTFPENEKFARRGPGFQPSNQKGKSAIALVFSNQAVRMLMQSPRMARRPRCRRRHAFIDGGVVDSFNDIGWKEYVCLPSLTQHTGHTSTMGHGRFAPARTFPGEDFDALSLLSPGG